MQSAAEWRRRAESLEKAGKFAEAADAYRKEAAIYRKNGDTEGAKVEESKAARISSSIQLFAHLPSVAPKIASPLAKWEPPYGCYLGGFIDRDERLSSTFSDENFQSHEDPAVFGEKTGKKHASVFCYVSYGRPFPKKWVARLKAQGVAPHIAWEPNEGLQVVQQNTYLRQFAQDAAEADCPIFLRYASEMNGDWTRYGGDGNAANYIVKWQLVRQVFAELAPNVAMVWCVNVIPEKNITKFYPGDAYVDWVGINFYSVPFYDNQLTRPGLADNPADYLKYVYATYATKKPIAICEFGASHLSKVDGKDRSAWASKKINELYAALPRLYPRVKLVDIFDMDNLKYATPGRQLNNYSVTDSDEVLAGYKRAIAPDYFLSRIGATAKVATTIPIPATGLTVPAGELRVSSWARCYADQFRVTYKVDGKDAGAGTEPGGREATLTLSPGPHKLTAVLTDDKGRVATKTEASLTAK
jgi:Glycosyl hydrolase family 26